MTIIARKYKRGKQIKTVGEFEQSNATFFWVLFGQNTERTVHRAFLISWQYHTLELFIKRGWVFEADRKDGENAKEHRPTVQCQGTLGP